MAGFEYDYVTLLALRMLCKEFISISLAFSFGRRKRLQQATCGRYFAFSKWKKHFLFSKISEYM